MHVQTAPTPAPRARPLSLEDRRSSIIDAVIPLLAVHGRDLTSRQIAEAAGVAEGTIFRAFGDKDTLIGAAIARFLEPGQLRDELRAIDPALDLHTKMLRIVTLMQNRFREVFRVMALIGHDHPAHPRQGGVLAEIIGEVLAPDLESLAWPPARVAQVLRLLTFAVSVPQLSDGVDFTPEELTAIALHGIVARVPGHPHSTESRD